MNLSDLDHLARQQKFEEATSYSYILNSNHERQILEARIQLWKLNFKDALKIIEEVNDLLNEDQKQLKFICLLTKIHLFWVGLLGDKQDNVNTVFEALENIYNSFTPQERSELSLFEGLYLHWIGMKEAFQEWNLEEGIRYFKESMRVVERLGYEIFAKNLFSNMGIAYTLLGDLDKGLDLISQASRLNQKYNLQHEQHYENSYFAINYQYRGDTQTSLKYLLESYHGHKKYGSNIYGHIYRHLIEVYTEFGKIEKAKFYLEELKNETPKPPASHIEFCHAIILRKSQRGRDKAKAQDFFTQRVYDDNLRHLEFADAATFYLETLFEELEAFGGDEILQEIYSLTDRMQTQSERFNDKKLHITTLIGKSKIAFIASDLQNAEGYLKDAENLIQENNMKLFFDQLNSEKRILEQNKVKILDLSNSQSDLRKKMDLAEYKEYLDHAKRIANKY